MQNYVNNLTRTKPAITAQGISSSFRVAIVAIHNVSALNHNLTILIGAKRLSSGEVDYLECEFKMFYRYLNLGYMTEERHL